MEVLQCQDKESRCGQNDSPYDVEEAGGGSVEHHLHHHRAGQVDEGQCEDGEIPVSLKTGLLLVSAGMY